MYVLIKPDRVTAENYRKIKVGMPKAEVLAVLGKPWDDSLFDPEAPDVRVESPATLVGDGGSIEDLSYVSFHGSSEMCYAPTYWYGKGLMLGVVFDENRCVIAKGSQLVPERPQPGLACRAWKRLRARMGW